MLDGEPSVFAVLRYFEDLRFVAFIARQRGYRVTFAPRWLSVDDHMWPPPLEEAPIDASAVDSEERRMIALRVLERERTGRSS